MNWNELKNRKSAPEQGYMLAYYQKKVCFEKYSNVDELKALNSGTEELGKLLELHLFDNQKEYRAILSCSRRYSDGYVEHIAEFEESDYSTIKETILLEDGGKLVVLNHITYDERGMASIDDFRLVGKE